MDESKTVLSLQHEDDDNVRILKKEEETEKTKTQLFLTSLKNSVIKNFLPIALIFAVVFGTLVPAPGVFFNHKVTVYVCISIMFLYSGLYLRTSAMKDAFISYKAWIWGLISILAVTCIVGGQLAKLLNFDKYPSSSSFLSYNSSAVNGSIDRISYKTNSIGPFEFKIALILYASMPCTVASGVIMVSNLKGHFALAIMLTVISNIVGIFTIPLYVSWLVVSDVNIQFDLGAMMLKLFLVLFIPLSVGKTLRVNKKLREYITVPKRKIIFKIISICSLAFILLVKTSLSSASGSMAKLTPIAALVLVFWTLSMHLLFLLINTVAVFILRLPTDQKKCIIILASQKTLSQAVAASVFLPLTLGDQGLIAVGMVFCHITVIVFDSVLIPVWLYIEEWYEKRHATLLEMDGVKLKSIIDDTEINA